MPRDWPVAADRSSLRGLGLRRSPLTTDPPETRHIVEESTQSRPNPQDFTRFDTRDCIPPTASCEIAISSPEHSRNGLAMRPARGFAGMAGQVHPKPPTPSRGDPLKGG